MVILDSYILQQTEIYISKGMNLQNIIDEYLRELDLDAEFMENIKSAYYHLNGGPDLRDYQQNCLDHYLNYYKNSININYQLRWCCGLGKTKMASTIIKRSGYRSICIGLPSIILLEQFYQELKLFFPGNKICRVYSGKDSDEEGDIQAKTSDDLKSYLIGMDQYKIVLVTYHSSKKVRDSGFKFDLLVSDEAHHLEGKTQRKFNNFLAISCDKRLFLTATPYIGLEDSKRLSFTDSSIFAGQNDSKSVKWSIENQYITDYRIVILNMREVDYRKLSRPYIPTDLTIAAYMAVRALYQGISKKILIYSNTVANAKMITDLIDDFLEECNAMETEVNPMGKDLQIGNYELNGTHSHPVRKTCIEDFKSIEYGIMSSVQLFGEGFDYPSLDTVIFAEKMSSDIRIVQSGLRPCRKDITNHEKVAHIMIPIQDGDFSKVKQVICKMKEIDDIRGKISVVGRNFTRSLCSRNGMNTDDYLNKVLSRIRLDYLEETEKIDLPDVKSSTILECKVNDVKIENLHYRNILIHIFKCMGREKVLEQSKFRFADKENHGKRGYIWNKDLQVCILGYDANNTLKEIARLIKNNNYNLEMKIKLKNGLVKNIAFL